MFKKYNSLGLTTWRLKNYRLIVSTAYLFQKNKTKSLSDDTLQMVTSVKSCKKSNIKGHRLKLDNRPAVGIALRER